MIRAKFEKKADMHNITVKGHAGFAPCGQDIVCSGVSAVVFGLIGFIDNNSEHIQEKKIHFSDGDFDLFIIGDEKIEAGVEFALISISQIAEKYPENVKVEAV